MNLKLLSLFFTVIISFPSVSFADVTLTQYGISWTLSGDVQYGQFITGDYYVVDSGSGVVVTAITPSHVVQQFEGTDYDLNGSMVNPDPGYLHGYVGKSSSGDDYSASLNAGKSLPITLHSGDVLISSDYQADLNMTVIANMAVLTVLSSAPPTGSFRPGYCDLSRKIFNESELDYTKLRNLTPPIGSPTLSSLVPDFQRPWVDHGYGSTSVWVKPYYNMLPYGAAMASKIGEGALALNLNYSNAEKRSLLVGLVQVGIDFYSIKKRAMDLMPSYVGTKPPKSMWANDGGNVHGHKWPILFSGLMLNDTTMKSIGDKTGDYILQGIYNADGTLTSPSDYFHFAEDDQTFYITQYDVGITNGIYWSPDTRTTPNSPYTVSMIGMPEWAIRHSEAPYQSDANWGANYRPGTTGKTFTGFVLAAKIMGAKTLWNHDVLFDYVDRYMAIMNGDPDPFGYTVPDEAAGDRTSGFVGDMYDTYRNYTPGTKYKNVKSITQENP